MVILDASAWLEFLQHPATDVGQEISRLLESEQIAVTGVVLGEVLGKARTEADQARLRSAFEALPYVELSRATWHRVGELSLQTRDSDELATPAEARERSLSSPLPSNVLAVAALALERGYEVLSLDRRYRRIPGLTLHARAS